MSKTENNRVSIDLDICVQSEACADVCPEKAIQMISDYPMFFKDCADPCQVCFDVCPSIAITMK